MSNNKCIELKNTRDMYSQQVVVVVAVFQTEERSAAAAHALVLASHTVLVLQALEKKKTTCQFGKLC